MSADPYSHCPCGSGKKLKFCCMDILPEIQRAQRLIEHQPDAALRIFRDLFARHPDRETVVLGLCGQLTANGEPAEARTILTSFCEKNPKDARAHVALAQICLSMDGYEAARRTIHRALQLAFRAQPATARNLVLDLSMSVGLGQNPVATRQYLELAAKLTSGAEAVAQIKAALKHADSTGRTLSILRGPFDLMSVDNLPDADAAQTEHRARKLADIGCWEPAAILYRRLLETSPENGRLHFNLAICLTNDLRQAEAIDAFKEAGRFLESDIDGSGAYAIGRALEEVELREPAVALECSVPLSDDIRALQDVLDESPRFQLEEDDDESPDSVITYAVLSAAPGDGPEPSDDVTVIGTFAIETYEPDETDDIAGTFGVVIGEEDDFDALCQLVEDTAGHLLLMDEATEPDENFSTPAIVRHFTDARYIADNSSPLAVRRYRMNCLESTLRAWADTPTSSLDDIKPIDAVGRDDLRRRLEAELLLVDSAVRASSDIAAIPMLREILNLPAGEALDIGEDGAVTRLSTVCLMRIDPESLTDRQLREYLNRAELLRLTERMYAALKVVEKRGASELGYSETSIRMQLGLIAASDGDFPEVRRQFRMARESLKDDGTRFQMQTRIDVYELHAVLGDPQTPEVAEIVGEIRDRYSAKLPEVIEAVRESLTSSGREDLFPMLESVAAGTGEKSKLWLPPGV